MGKYQALSKDIIKQIGGKENIQSLSHCITRLRFVLKDESKANDEVLKNMEGVVSVIKSAGQYQVVIGNHVSDVYKDVCEVAGISSAASVDDEEKKGKFSDKILDLISGIFMPTIAIMTGSGMIKGLLALAVYFGWIDNASDHYTLIYNVSDAFFLFMPVIIGYTSAKKFGMDPMVGLVIGAALMTPALQKVDLNIFGYGINVGYTGTVLPVILTNAVAAYMYKRLNKVIPDVVKTFFTPLIILAICAPLGYLAIGPAANWISEVLLGAIMSVYTISPIVAGLLLGGLWQVMIVFGVHTVFAITGIVTLASGNPTPILALMYTASFAQVAAVFAIWLKTKDKKLKGIALPGWISAIFGVTEPAIYGITLPRIKIFAITCIGGALGGAYIGATNLLKWQMAGMGIFGIPGFFETNGDTGRILFHIGIALLITMGFTFVATMALFKDEKKKTDDRIKAPKPMENQNEKQVVFTPIEGEVIALHKVADAAFAEGHLGKGVGIIPKKGEVKSPFNGTVTTLFPTGHAVGITSDSGIEMLVHVGFDTVKLKGEPFNPKVKQGDRVEQGEVLLTFDIDKIKKAGCGIETPVIITNTNQFAEVISFEKNNAKYGDEILTIVS